MIPAVWGVPSEFVASVLSVIVPANNEAAYIGECLDALLASEPPSLSDALPVEIIVVANACIDETVVVAESRRPATENKGWRLLVVDVERGGKLNALNVGETEAGGDMIAYIDADVIVSPLLLMQIKEALDRPYPTYASGRMTIARAATWTSRAYARLFARVPFMTDVVPGAGVFAVNAAGRARWGAFPEIIADDTFVRLQFSPEERVGVPATFQWPMPEGFGNLIRVRRRQDAGVAEVAQLYPALLRNDDKPRMGLRRIAGLALRDPLGFCVYAGVALAVRLPATVTRDRWVRGR